MNDGQNTSPWSTAHTVVLIASVALIIAIGLLAPITISRITVWLAILALLVATSCVISHGFTGSLLGLLIDERNRMSLSRFQMGIWANLVLSAFLTAVLTNVAAGNARPANIGVPDQLCLLMGITTTALVGSPVVRTIVASRRVQVNPEARDRELIAMASERGVTRDNIRTRGSIVLFANREMASLADLFRGEETGNANSFDLGKVQMFYFTLATAISYGVSIAAAFAVSKDFMFAFPDLNANMVFLLGISNGGYLTNKAVPRISVDEADSAATPQPDDSGDANAPTGALTGAPTGNALASPKGRRP